MYTIIRVTTIPVSLKVLLKGQIDFMQQNGFKVIAVSAFGKEVEELKQQENCEHFIIPLTRTINPIQDLICIIKLVSFLKKIKPVIVHTHTPKAGFVGMIAANIAKVPIRLHTIAGLPWITTSGVKRYVLKIVEKLTATASSKVYVNSKNLLSFLKNQHIANKKFCVLGAGTSNGIDIEYFTNSNKIKEQALKLKKNNGVNENAWIWLFVGRIVKDKGVQELLKAFSEFHDQYPGDQLWIVGEEEIDLDPINTESNTLLNTHSNIKKMGFHNDVRSYYAAANMLVFPSYREGFPNVPIQAALMDCGLILSNINGCNEIIENNKTGLLVEVKSDIEILNKMIFARKNHQLINQYKLKLKEQIKFNYSQEIVWQNLLNEYKKLIVENGL
jgi:glycosyltransferase involved in cell wall biosynthesis